MKWIKITCLALIGVILVIFIGVTVFIKTLDVNKFKDTIAGRISSSIDRTVAIKDLDFRFSLTNGMTLKMSGFSIMDDPRFSTEAMLYVDSAFMQVEVIPFLTHRKVLVSQVELHSPKINLIKDSEGTVNFQLLARKKDKPATEPGTADVTSAVRTTGDSPDSDEEVLSLGHLQVRSVKVSDGEIYYRDDTFSPPLKVPATHMEVVIDNMSFTETFPFWISASVWSRKPNVNGAGLARINEPSKQSRLDDLKINMDLSLLSWPSLAESVPGLKDLKMEEGPSGSLAVDVPQVVIGQEGLLVFTSIIRLKDLAFKLDAMPVPVRDMNVELDVSDTELNINQAVLSLASGEVRAKGRVIDYRTDQTFTGRVTADDIKLDELTAPFDLPANVTGRLHGAFDLNGSGFSHPVLAGGGIVEVEDGRLTDVNLLKLALSKLSFVPNLAEKLEANLPERYKAKLQKNDTVLEKVRAQTKWADSVLKIEKVEVMADGFLVTAHGQLDLDQNIILDADLVIPEDLSASMVASVEEMSFLLNARKEIRIPFKQYRGPVSRLSMAPNVGNIGQNIIRSKGKDELKKVILDAIGVERGTPAEPVESGPPENQPAGTQPPPREKTPEEEIIDNILDMIPIFEKK